MSVVARTPDRLEMEIGLPRFILWFMLTPLIPLGLIGFFNLFSGSIMSGLVLIFGVGGAFVLGTLYIGERTLLTLDAAANLVRIERVSRFGRTESEHPLDALDSAETETSGGGTDRRASHKPLLVFRHTRPATRIPLTRWGVSGGGPGGIADEINDWLTQVRDRAEARPE